MPTWLRALRLGLIATIMTVPMLMMVLAPDHTGVSLNEARKLATVPGLPARLSDWLKLPRQFSLYLQDHFGLREVLTHSRSLALFSWFRSSNENVMIGTNDRLYTRAEAAVSQSAGLVVRRQRLVQTADVIARVYGLLHRRGVKFIYTLAPNAATIQTTDLPEWAKHPGHVTEYDVLLDLLHARGVPADDMRPAMRRALSQGSLYLHNDTHWNPLGALVGFNAVAVFSGHPDWQEDPAVLLAPPSRRIGGDLARMLGINADVEAAEPEPKFPGYAYVDLSPIASTAATLTTDHPGPRILILGDSFTLGVFGQFVARHAAQVTWINHQTCGFDWNWIKQANPDEVWWIPTERFVLCSGLPVHEP